MTITDLPITYLRTRHRADRVTPQSQDAASLREMLEDPALAGWHEQIRAALVELTATSVLAA